MRIRDVEVTGDLLVELIFRNDPEPNGLARWLTSDSPTDLSIIGVREDTRHATYIFRVESESFSDVVPGQTVPFWRPQFTQHTLPIPEGVPA